MSMSATNSNHEAAGVSQTQPPNNIASSSNNLPLAPLPLSLIYRGFKFTPYDIDVCCYLDLFFKGYNLSEHVPIHRVNIYESTPEQLSNEYVKGNEKEWFFITERTKMSEGGKNLIRTDNLGGTWKAATKAKKIEDTQGVVVGNKTPLEYYFAGSVKGDWLMAEYSCDSYRQNNKVDYALCKIYLTPTADRRKAEDEKKKIKKEIEVLKALEEELDKPLDDVAFQPPPQLQEQQPNDAYQVPLDSHQQISNYDVSHYFQVPLVSPQQLEMDGGEEYMDWSFLEDPIYDEELNNGPLAEPDLQEPFRFGESSQNQPLNPNEFVKELLLGVSPMRAAVTEELNEYEEGLLIDNPNPFAVRGVPNIYTPD